MRIIQKHDYIVIDCDEDVLQRATIKASDIGTAPPPVGVNLYYLYDKARKTKTTDAANVYAIYRQAYLNIWDKREKEATK